MKVKMLTSMSGNPRAAYGEEVDLDAATARRLIAKGMAEPATGGKRLPVIVARDPEAVETAVGDAQRPGLIERAIGRVFGRG